MKTLIEEVVARDESILEYIMILSQSNSWIFIGKDLINYLEETFENRNVNSSIISFTDEQENSIAITVKEDSAPLTWGKITYRDEPDHIYFLS